LIEIVLVCHEDLATYFLKVAEFLFKNKQNCQTVAIYEGEHPDAHQKRVEEAVKAAGAEGHPILILTDLFGGTACNVSLPYLKKDKVEVLSGVNLAMLIRAIQWRKRFPDIGLTELASECAKYAIEGIRVCSLGMNILSRKEDPKAKKSRKNAQDA
jgi:PTS system mannose-specific IIA component